MRVAQLFQLLQQQLLQEQQHVMKVAMTSKGYESDAPAAGAVPVAFAAPVADAADDLLAGASAVAVACKERLSKRFVWKEAPSEWFVCKEAPSEHFVHSLSLQFVPTCWGLAVDLSIL